MNDEYDFEKRMEWEVHDELSDSSLKKLKSAKKYLDKYSELDDTVAARFWAAEHWRLTNYRKDLLKHLRVLGD